MDPYRAPQDPPPPPKDAMRIVLWVGGIAGAVLAAVAGLGALQEYRSRPVVAASPAEPEAPQSPYVTASHYAFELTSGPCFGDCWSYRVTLDDSGRVTYAITDPYVHGKIVRCAQTDGSAEPGALQKLVADVKKAPLGGFKAVYHARMTDMSTWHTVIIADSRRFDFEHPPEIADHEHPDAEELQVQTLIDIHEDIAKAARMEEWKKGCEVTVEPPHPIRRLDYGLPLHHQGDAGRGRKERDDLEDLLNTR